MSKRNAVKAEHASHRQVKALPDIAKFACGPLNEPPQLLWIEPERLVIDETYQRNLSMNGKRLITKLVQNWDWTRFKCPIVTKDDRERLFVLDGQHTAIAAATHPQITKIPVMVVKADSLKLRARAFIGHNKDRINVTATQLHHSSVVAEDSDAMAMDRVCRASGIRIVRVPPMGKNFAVNETTAIGAIKGLITKYGEDRAIEALAILAKAGLAPVRADHVRCVALLLFSDAYKGEFSREELSEAFSMVKFEDAMREAREVATSTGNKPWECLATVYTQAIEQSKEDA